MKLLSTSRPGERRATLVQTDVEESELTEEIEQLREEKNEIQVKYEARLSTIKRCLILTRSLLIQRSHWEKKHARRAALSNRLRLGQYRSERHGISLVQQWIEGNDFGEKQRRRTELQLERKDLPKRKAEEEVSRLRHVALKREESELTTELDALERERRRHLRELQRLDDEDRSPFNHSRLLHHRYLLLTLIHKGKNSELHRAFDFREQSDVLCQIHLRSPELTDDEHRKNVEQLAEHFALRQSFQHPHLLRYIDFFEIDEGVFCTAMEFCDGGNLETFLQSTPSLPEREARVILMQLINALTYLSNEVKPTRIHGDLRAENILFKGKNNCGELKLINVSLTNDQAERSAAAAETRSLADLFYRCLYGRALPSTPLVFPPRPPVSQSAKIFLRRCLTDDLLQLSADDYLRSCPKRLSVGSPSSLFSRRTNEPFS